MPQTQAGTVQSCSGSLTEPHQGRKAASGDVYGAKMMNIISLSKYIHLDLTGPKCFVGGKVEKNVILTKLKRLLRVERHAD